MRPAGHASKGGKTRTRQYKQLQSALGEESVTDDEDTTDEFQSVSTDNGATNYGLEYTGHSLRSGATPRKRTARSPSATPRRQMARSPNTRGQSASKRTARSPTATSSRQVARSPNTRGQSASKPGTSRAAAASSATDSELDTQTDADQQPSGSRREAQESGSRQPTKKPQQRAPRASTSRAQTSQAPNTRAQTSQASTSRVQTVSKSSSRRDGTQSASPNQSRRKQKAPKKRKSHILKEIRTLQSSLKNQIAKLPFSRLIRELLMENADHTMRITMPALEALQESAELYLTQLFEDAYRCTVHRNRVTLLIKDMELVRYLRGPNDPGNGI